MSASTRMQSTGMTLRLLCFVLSFVLLLGYCENVDLEQQIASVDEKFEFEIPFETLQLVDGSRQYTYNASYSSAQTWLRFMPQRYRFEGIPSSTDFGILEVLVELKNVVGTLINTVRFDIEVGAAPLWVAGVSDVRQEVFVGETLQFTVASSDFKKLDNGIFNLSLAMNRSEDNFPEWLFFKSKGGGHMTVDGVPSRRHVGVYDMLILATDQSGRVGSKTFILEVPNRAPKVKTAQKVIDAFTSRRVTVNLTELFFDEDRDRLKYYIPKKPGSDWAVVDEKSGILTGVPSLLSGSRSVFDVGARDPRNGTVTTSIAVNLSLDFFLMDLCLGYFGSGLAVALLFLFWKYRHRSIVKAFFHKARLRQANLEVLKLWPPPNNDLAPLQTIELLQQYLLRAQYNLALPLLEVVRYYFQEQCKDKSHRVTYWTLMRLCIDDVNTALVAEKVTYGVLQGVECVIDLVNIILFDSGYHDRLVSSQSRDVIVQCLHGIKKLLRQVQKRDKRDALPIEQDLSCNVEIALEGLKLVRGGMDYHPKQLVLRTISSILLPPFGLFLLWQENKRLPKGWEWYEKIIFARSCMPLVRTSSKVRSAFMREFLAHSAWQYTYGYLELLTLLGVRGKHAEDKKFVKSVLNSIKMCTDPVDCCGGVCGHCGGRRCCARFGYCSGHSKLLVHEKALRARKEVNDGVARAIELAPRAKAVLEEEKVQVERLTRKMDREVKREDRRVKRDLLKLFADGLVAIEEDKKEGVEMLEEAAALGYVMAMSALGRIYRKGGPGTPPDFNKCFRYLFHAAMLDNVVSYGRLGMAYLRGMGCEPDEERAAMWFVRGATHQEVGAMFGLGQRLLYSTPGNNTEYQVNLARAEKLFEAIIAKPETEEVEQKERDAAGMFLKEIAVRREQLESSGDLLSAKELQTALAKQLAQDGVKHGKLLAKEHKIFKKIAKLHEKNRLKLVAEREAEWDRLDALEDAELKHGDDDDDGEGDFRTPRTPISTARSSVSAMRTTQAMPKKMAMGFADDSDEGSVTGKFSAVGVSGAGGSQKRESVIANSNKFLLKQAPMGFAEDDSSDGGAQLIRATKRPSAITTTITRTTPQQPAAPPAVAAVSPKAPKKLAPLKLAPLKLKKKKSLPPPIVVHVPTEDDFEEVEDYEEDFEPEVLELSDEGVEMVVLVEDFSD